MGSKWEKIKLKEVVDIITTKVDVSQISLCDYISTENMLTNFGGISIANSKPSTGKITKFHSGDILFSNIRTYFKKLWLADRTGGCSNDVIVFRPKKNINSNYILSVLMDQKFIEHTVLTSKGTKMPRGDKTAILDYEFNLAPDKYCQHIAKTNTLIFSKLKSNEVINKSLEQMSQTLFKSWFVDFDPVIDNALDAGNPIPEAQQTRAKLRQKVRNSADFKPLPVEIRSLFPSEFEETELGWVPKGWTLKSVAKSININPSIKLPKNKIAKYVDMKSLPTQGYSISDIIEKPYSGGAKFQNNDTLFARITPCLENGKTGFVDFLDEKETAFGSTEFIVMRGTPQVHYLYVACLARENNFRLHAIQNMVGSSGRQRVQNSCFDSFYIAIPTPAVMSLFSGKVSSYFDKMYFCNLENKSLTALRDTLLPKLISG